MLSLIKEAVQNLEVNAAEKIKPVELSEGDIIADLHMHSRFSRATSKDLSIVNLVKWARIKGLNLLGTGDISHEKWLSEIRDKLKEDKGIFWFEDASGKFPFILTGEISLVFTLGGKGRRVHLVYLAPNLEVNDRINKYLDSKGRRDYDGRPIFKITCEEFVRVLRDIDKKIEIIPAHIWTSWFGVFGSESGFNSLKEAFGSQYENVHAIETGMSSTPDMNWKVSELGNRAIVSFSDSHSFWPWRLGREATIFSLPGNKNIEELNYDFIISNIRNNTIKSTIETPAEYGKYHYDGHRLCNFSCSPKQTKEIGGICPVCKKELVIGVENRVEELTNNSGIPKNAKHFFKLLPLHELIAFYLKTKVESKKTWSIYNSLIEKFGNEINILLKVDRNVLFSELGKDKLSGLAQLIIDNRIANLKVKPGYDGEYGVLVEKNSSEQKKLI